MSALAIRLPNHGACGGSIATMYRSQACRWSVRHHNVDRHGDNGFLVETATLFQHNSCRTLPRIARIGGAAARDPEEPRSFQPLLPFPPRLGNAAPGQSLGKNGRIAGRYRTEPRVPPFTGKFRGAPRIPGGAPRRLVWAGMAPHHPSDTLRIPQSRCEGARMGRRTPEW